MNYNHRHIKKPQPEIQCRELSISDVDVELKLKSNKIIRFLYMIGGSISLGLGILGIFVPGLPTTPLVLLSAALYAKSSEKLYNWLLENKYLGPRIKKYQRQKGVTLKAKYKIISFMFIMVFISSFLVLKVFMLRVIIIGAGIIGAIVVRFFVPTAKEEKSN